MTEEGTRIRRRRERLGWTQTELGRNAVEPGKRPIHRNTIAAMEEGKSGFRGKMAGVLRALDDGEGEAGLPPLPDEDAETQPQPKPGDLVVTTRHGDRVVVIRLIGDKVEVEGMDQARAAELVAMAIDLFRSQPDEPRQPE